MKLSMKLWVLVFCLTSLLAQATQQQPHSFLQKHMRFSPADLTAMDAGKVVVKLPKTEEVFEVVAFGVVRMQASAEPFLAKFRDIATFKQSKPVLKIKKLSSPPSLADFKDLTLDTQDLEALKKCQAGDCKVKLSLTMIERLRKEVKWPRPDAQKRATELYRQFLLEYVRDSLQTGNTALIEYCDKESPIRLSTEFQAQLKATPYLAEYVPEFLRYLELFPSGQLDEVENYLYWSKERFGLKPVVSITHVTLWRRRNGTSTQIIAASKQIYANHYFEASLGLTALLETAQEASQPNAYLLYLNNSHIDLLRGGWGRWKRSAISSRLRKGLETNLLSAKEKLEAPVAPP